jgi:hypothetical protein
MSTRTFIIKDFLLKSTLSPLTKNFLNICKIKLTKFNEAKALNLILNFETEEFYLVLDPQ